VDIVRLKRTLRLAIFGLMRRLSAPLSAVLPVEKGLVVFTCLTGENCLGNPAPLYEAFRTKSGFRAKWITPYRRHTLPGHIWWLSPRGLWYLLRMEGWVIDSRTPTFFSTHGKKVFQTWHGVGVKKMAGDNRFAPDESQRRALARDVANYTLFFTTSAFMARHFSHYLGIPPEKIRITGYPRNDVLFDEEMRPRVRLTVEQRCPTPFRKIVLYAPTWNRHTTNWWPFSATALQDMQEILAQNNAVWVTRLHRLGREQVARPGSLAGKRHFFSYEECFGKIDVQEALTSVDLLVTDYSSIAHDFLLLDRPMLFVERAADEFDREQGLVDDYQALLPGPITSDYDAFAAYFAEALNDKDTGHTQRAAILPLFHRYIDGNSTERCVRVITSALEEEK